MTEKPNILDTVDTFMGCVPQGSDRAVLIYRRQHAGREYVRFRVWHRHKKLGKFYPDKRRKFVVSLEHALDLGQAIIQAASGKSHEKPSWLIQYERNELEKK